jgi:hypothetical protein
MRDITIEITARTSRICIRLPTEYTNTPIAHPIRRITAMTYKILLMVIFV